MRAADLVLSDEDLAQAAVLFELSPLKHLGGFENLLLSTTQGPGRVLRVTSANRRTRGLVEAELRFVEHLANAGVTVARPRRSRGGSLCEELVTASGDHVILTCMDRAAGGKKGPTGWSELEIEAYGQLLGALHRASETYRPAHGVARRPDWHDPLFDPGLNRADTAPALRERYHARHAACVIHPAGGTDLLIHLDAHHGNLFTTGGPQLTLFDFDDCGYGTATHDVAIVLFYWLMGHDSPLEELRRFSQIFLSGYQKHAKLPPSWAEGAERFLSLRELEIYYLLSEVPPANWNERHRSFMANREQRILQGRPYLGLAIAEVL